MTDWWLVLAGALALGALVTLFRFIGCGGDPFTSAIPAEPYDDIILAEPGLVSYWRLNEAAGPTANDEKAAHPGTYTTVVLAEDLPNRSPAAPGTLEFAQASLLGGEPDAHSVRVNGGYVEVPNQDSLNPSTALNPPQFSIEAWVHPEWPDTEMDRFRAVLESYSEQGGGRFGYSLYSGPIVDAMGTTVDPKPYWQAYLYNGSAEQSVTGPLVTVDTTAHLVVTYDGTTLKLYVDGPNDDAGTPDAQANVGPYSPNPDAPLRIGMGATHPTGPGPLWPFRGRLQSVAVYKSALDFERVTAHYLRGSVSP
jgi:hypothetical protein